MNCQNGLHASFSGIKTSKKIPIGLRFFVIFHLCLVFTILFWFGGHPFMSEPLFWKSRLAITESLLQEDTRVSSLSDVDLGLIMQTKNTIQTNLNSSFLHKLSKALSILFFELPPFFRSWLFFSILISILLLRGHVNSRFTVWILPLLIFFQGISQYGTPLPQTREETLFPSEAYLLNHYPPSRKTLSQFDQLKESWNQYLISEWTENSQVTQDFLKNAQFSFNLSRVKRLSEDIQSHSFLSWHVLPGYCLYLFFIWSLILSIFTTKYKTN